jgi:hypothetical protein
MRVWTVGLVGVLSLAVFGCGRTANQRSGSSQVDAQGGDGSGGASGSTGHLGSPDGSDGGSSGASFNSWGSSTGGSGFGSNQSCHATQTQCMGNVLYGCDLDLDHLAPLVDCTTTNPDGYCNPQAKGGPACDVRACHPNETRCMNTTLFTCGVDSHWLPGAEDQKVCPPPPKPDPICEPFTSVCADSLFKVCLESGLAYSAPSACDGDRHCLDLGDYDQCIPNACQPGTTVCLGNQVGVCASDGQSLSQVTLDCPAQGEICIDVLCGWSVGDGLGQRAGHGNSVNGVVELLMVDVHTDRTLLALTSFLDLTTRSTIHWLVYESGSAGYELVLDTTTTAPAGNEGVGTDPIANPLNLPLRAGKRYVFGMSVSGKGYFYRESTLGGHELSFGRVYGSNAFEGDYHTLPANLDPNDYEIAFDIQTTPPLP